MKHICDWVLMALIGFSLLGKWANGSDFDDAEFHPNTTQMLSYLENFSNYSQSAAVYNPLYVGLTLIPGAAAKGAGTFNSLFHILKRGFADTNLDQICYVFRYLISGFECFPCWVL